MLYQLVVLLKRKIIENIFHRLNLSNKIKTNIDKIISLVEEKKYE